jgi:GNAT superfamily N-acetyltransferase
VSYRAPRPLSADDIVDGFECRSSEQTSWLTRHAKQSAAAGSTKVFVVTEDDRQHVVAYYAWSMAQLLHADSPERLTKGAGRYPQPVALLARLGVDRRHEGQGLGAALLKDAVTRLLVVRNEIGCRGLLIHAESDEARGFYLHLIPELDVSPTDHLHLVLLVKDALRSLKRGL